MDRTEELVSGLQAIEVLERIEHADHAVIGIEGFLVEGTDVYPQLDMIADFSGMSECDWRKYRDTCNQAAYKFINEFKNQKNVCFTFVVSNKKQFKDSRSR